MKAISLIVVGVIAIMIISIMFTACKATVPAGSVGIIIKSDGSQRGVQDYTLTTGRVWINPITESMVEFPVFYQTIKWTKSMTEGKAENQEISFSTSEGNVVRSDVSISYKFKANTVPKFYHTFKISELSVFSDGMLRDKVRDGFVVYAAALTLDQICSIKKIALRDSVIACLNRDLGEFIEVKSLSYLGEFRYDEQVQAAITSKINQTQIAMETENKLRTAEAENRIKIANAETDAKANMIKAQSLSSPTAIRMKELENQRAAIDKWNNSLPSTILLSNSGQLPFVGNVIK